MDTHINILPPDPFPGVTAFYSKILTPFLHPINLWHTVTESAPFFIFITLLVVVCIAFFAGTVYIVIKSNEIHRKINQSNNIPVIRKKIEEKTKSKSKRWEQVERLMSGTSEAEWRAAVIEADALLEETVRKLGYGGETLGEMLKKADLSDIPSLDAAWAAHKIRNQIAHQGSSFMLTPREAKRVIGLYEKVFREIGVI